jgi:hypothetical protein
MDHFPSTADAAEVATLLRLQLLAPIRQCNKRLPYTAAG